MFNGCEGPHARSMRPWRDKDLAEIKELGYVGALNGAGHPRVVFFGLGPASEAAASDGRLSGRRADAAFEFRL